MEFLKKLYADKTVYRLIWTAIQVGAGMVTVALGADPVWGVMVTTLAVIVTSEARKRLGS